MKDGYYACKLPMEKIRVYWDMFKLYGYGPNRRLCGNDYAHLLIEGKTLNAGTKQHDYLTNGYQLITEKELLDYVIKGVVTEKPKLLFKDLALGDKFKFAGEDIDYVARKVEYDYKAAYVYESIPKDLSNILWNVFTDRGDKADKEVIRLS